jgi:hypothetical protein
VSPAPAGVDSGAVETGAVETGAVETGAVETGAVETGIVETGGSVDTGTSAGVPGRAALLVTPTDGGDTTADGAATPSDASRSRRTS